MSVASFFLENLASQLHPKSFSMLNQRSGTQRKAAFSNPNHGGKTCREEIPHFKNRESGWRAGPPTPGDNTEYLEIQNKLKIGRLRQVLLHELTFKNDI